jgi:hypothetical protein
MSPKTPRDLNGELVEWVRSCTDEPPLHILAALMGNAVNLARALDFSLAGFLGGIEMHWGLYVAAAARKQQGEASGAPSVAALLRALQGKSK